jgi:hypothetical protein
MRNQDFRAPQAFRRFLAKLDSRFLTSWVAGVL